MDPGGGSGIHRRRYNVPGAVVLARKPPLFEAWRADTKELDAAGPSLARLLDRIGPPGGGGLLGLISDGLMALNSVITMEVTHARAVVAAAEKLERDELEEAHRRADGPERPPGDRRVITSPGPARRCSDGFHKFRV